jgi:predicted metal-dependent phosphoesterase TrpH
VTPAGTDPEASRRMLKVELHAHTADDPVDAIPHTTRDLIDRAASLGYGALAITLHERQLDIASHAAYAADHGITLIPGVERTIEGRHVLLLNFGRRAEDVKTFDDLRDLRMRERGLVVAPHPFFPARVCLGRDLERHVELFDAVERNAMFVRGLDFNARAEAWAQRYGKPVVGNCDVHRIDQLGSTYSLVDVKAGADAAAICEAIRAGRVSVVSRPLHWFDAARFFGSMTLEELRASGLWPARRAAARRRLQLN